MKEALKLALEALKDFDYDKRLAAIKVCEEALKQKQGEPIAWMSKDGQRVTTAINWRNYPDYETRYPIPLYTTPQPQEFVCSTGLCRFTLTQTNVGIGERGMEAYEAAKERGWVGLSDERLMEMPKQMKERCDSMEMRGAFADGWLSAEAAHGIKE